MKDGQITKNQHYIPQFMLRNFAREQNDEYKVNIYDLKRNVVRSNQNVKKVCSKNYCYDRDNIIEQFLSDKVETPAAVYITKILDNQSSFKGPIGIDLLRF